jgi:hypothetical protein
MAGQQSDLSSLEPPLPWTAPDPVQPELWPWPDDRDIDLNAIDGPDWLDDTAQTASTRLKAASLDRVVGHGDWYSGNLRWTGRQLHVVWDWDSVIRVPEAAIAGLAAAVFPAVHAGSEATVNETESFLAAYASTRGRPFTPDEIEIAWAAGLWNRSFDAKKQVAVGEPPRSLTPDEARERLRRAALI